MIKIVVSGCCGRMGRRIITLVCRDKNFEIAGAIEKKNHPAVGRKLSTVLMNLALTIEVKDNPEIIKDADVLIDFTNPLATVECLILAVKYKKPVVIGTTGLAPAQVEKVKEASKEIPIVFSPNMSLGVNLVFRLVKQATGRLEKDYKVDIVEAHHANKKDAPSGTAKRLVELVKETPGREKEHIRIESIRQGRIVGDHQVRFNSPRDVIIIKHSAKSRDIFCQGALEAAKFIVKQNPGLYDMQDVLG